jgi:hypothetical protein
MHATPRAILTYLQAIRVVPFVLGGCVVSFLALRTGKGDDDPRLTLLGHITPIGKSADQQLVIC